MQYLKKFDNVNDLNIYKNSPNYIRPNVSLVNNKIENYEQRYIPTKLVLSEDSDFKLTIPFNKELEEYKTYVNFGIYVGGNRYTTNTIRQDMNYVCFNLKNMYVGRPTYPLVYRGVNNYNIKCNAGALGSGEIDHINSKDGITQYYEDNFMPSYAANHADPLIFTSLYINSKDIDPNGNELEKFYLELHHFTISYESEIIFDFIPLYDKQLNKIVLYDKINNKYY